MPLSSSWPVSSLRDTCSAGSSRVSTASASSSALASAAPAVSSAAVNTGVGSATPASTTGAGSDASTSVSPVHTDLRPVAAPMLPAATASTSRCVSANTCNTLPGRSFTPRLAFSSGSLAGNTPE